jgi:hypothetical protein
MRPTGTVIAAVTVIAVLAAPAAADQPSLGDREPNAPGHLVRLEVEPTTSVIHILPTRSRDVVNPSFTMVSASCIDCVGTCPTFVRTVDVVLEALTDVDPGYGVSDLMTTNYSSTGVSYSTQEALEAGDQVTVTLAGTVLNCAVTFKVFFSMCDNPPQDPTDACLPTQLGFLQASGGTSSDSSYAAEQTSDGGYVVAGFTDSYGAGSSDVLLQRYDGAGTLLWTRTAGGASPDYGWDVQQTGDGGYVVAGDTDSYGAGNRDVLLQRYDSSGGLAWTRTAGGTSYDYAYAVQQTADAGYVVVGSTLSYGAGGYDVLLQKYDGAGSLLWTRTAGGPGNDLGEAVQQTGDGGYVVVGSTDSYGAGFYDVLLQRYDGAGVLLWARTAGGTGYDEGFAVQQTADGGFVVAGYTDSYGAGSTDVLLQRFDGAGTLLWTRTAGGAGSDYGWSVQQTVDGGSVVAGRTYSYGAGSADVVIQRYDGAGTHLWTRTAGGTNLDDGWSVQQTVDGGYVVAGSTYSYGAGSSDLLLLTTDANGDIPGCAAIAPAYPTVTSPTPSTSAPTLTTGSPTVTVTSPTVTVTSPTPAVDRECP